MTTKLSLPGLSKPTPQQKSLADFNQRAMALLHAKNRQNQVADCQQLLRLYPKQPQAHFLMARAFVESNQKRLAFPYAEAAHTLEPDNAHYAFYLGYLYMDFKLHEFALPLFRKAAARHNGICQFQEALAECYQELGKGDVAIKYFRAALPIAPDEATRTRLLSKFAHTLVTSDLLDEAKDIVNQLLAGNDAAYLAGVRESALMTKSGVNSVEGERLIKVLQREDLSPAKRTDFLLALGRLYERDKNYETAFRCWWQAREISKTENWKVKDHATMLAEVKQFYSADLFAALKEHGHSTTIPVFVVGMPRSGTTLTEQIIAAHPLASGVGELGRFEALDIAFRKDYPAERRLERLLKNAKGGELRSRAEETLRIIDVIVEGKFDRIVEKTPHNFRNVGYLKLLFPNSKIIHCRRDPLDTFISSYQNNLNKHHGYAYDQVEYLKEYLYQEELMSYWKSMFPDDIMTLHYEHMVTAPDLWARNITDFIDLPWSDECLRFFEKGKTVRTFSSQQVRSPVHAGSVARWRRYEKQLSPILQALNASGFEYSAPETA